ncbi:hypothetical protein F5Y17DRAFT_432915 [Xylariaceae sp. FL0594]|nr:hypothetical protein F5Y17DRAFT_432915 [Xylariaceae sp. FL0594]
MATEAVCKVCEEPLVVEIEGEDDGSTGPPQTVPDDLQLSCGCHFHWQCLLDQSAEVAFSLRCPSCQSVLAESSAGSSSAASSPLPPAAGVSILSRYTNEGGVQENLDVAPAITEEAYLSAHPEARPALAFHVMCSEGDVDGIVDLLRDVDQSGGGDDDEEQHPRLSPAQIIRSQDPLSGMKSGLHLAIEQGQQEVVWLLLWLASPLRTEAFPAPLREIAQAVGLQRPPTTPADDIRAIRDGQGQTAQDIASNYCEGLWAAFLENNVLQPGLS